MHDNGDKPKRSRRILVVDPSAIWGGRKVALVAAVIGAASVAGLYRVQRAAETMGYEMYDRVFVPVAIGILLLFPVTTVIAFYRRIPRETLALLYALSFAIGWAMTRQAVQIIEYGRWKALGAGDLTIVAWAFHLTFLLFISVAIYLPILLLAWVAVRLYRGAAIVTDQPTCRSCGYNLTGIVSGVCPECGEKV